MSLVAQCVRGSAPVTRSQSRIRLKARENKSGELRAAHIATVHASAGPSTPSGKQREERRAEWKTQRRQPAAMDMDWDPEAEPEPDPEPEPEPEPAPAPPTLRPPTPTGPPMPLDCEDPIMLQQLQVFCMYFANSTFLTPYNQLQRRLGRPKQNSIKPAFDEPSNQELLAKLQQLGSVNFTERYVKLYAKAARAQLGWSGEEAQLFIKLTCGYSLNTDSPELQAAHLDKAHVNDLIEEAAKQRRLLALEGDSLQDTVPLPCRMRHAVHVCRCLEQWQQPPTPPVPGKPKHGGPGSGSPKCSSSSGPCSGTVRIGKGLAEQREFVFNPATQIGVGIDPGVTQAVSAASGVWDPATGQLLVDQLRRWKLTKGQVKHGSGLNNARRDTERWLAPIKPHLQHLAAASSAGTSLEANQKHITVTLATWDAVWEVYLDPKWARQRLRLYGAEDRTLEQFF
ncbi:hypothetical protein QJQ45_010023 [Haematococcus lacustris]|nr:hypothetical protein QJQ45_010023 [Haematococcus lacustris]